MAQISFDEDSSLFKWRPTPFSYREENSKIAKINWHNLKIFFSRTPWPISTKPGTKHPWWKRFNFKQIRTYQFSKRRWLLFCLYSTLWDNHIFAQLFIDRQCFSGEWCGPWASCLMVNRIRNTILQLLT